LIVIFRKSRVSGVDDFAQKLRANLAALDNVSETTLAPTVMLKPLSLVLFAVTFASPCIAAQVKYQMNCGLGKD
jgi:hypothetical protein